MFAYLLKGSVGVSVIHHRTIVRAENDERVLRDAKTIQCGHELSDGPIEFEDAVGTESVGRLALESLVRHARHMRFVRGIKKEEGLVLLRFDARDATPHPLVGEVLVTESRLFPARVEADTADPVVDRVVVTVRPVHLEGVAMRHAGWMGFRGNLLVNAYRVGRIEIADTTILQIDLRDAVVRRWQKKTMAKADVERARSDFCIPIRPFRTS